MGGASGFGRLAPDLAALAVPVVVWPDRDDSGAPRGAARAGAAARSTAHGSDAAAGRTCPGLPLADAQKLVGFTA